MGRGYWGALLVTAGLVACDLEAGAEGETCVRTSQCEMLLACVDGVCTSELDSVADQSTIPDLAQGPEGDDMADAAMADAAMVDAAMVVDAGVSPGADDDAGN